MIDADPAFQDIDGPDNTEATVLDNNYRLYTTSPGKDSGDNNLIPADLGDVNDNTNTAEDVPWDLDANDRVLFVVTDRGAYEFTCLGDCVTNNNDFPEIPDGAVDGGDLAFLLFQWGECEGCCSDIVDSATFQPPPDGLVDGADLAVLLGNWGDPCERTDEEESLAGPSNPFSGSDLGILLDELIVTSDAELAAVVAALLQELMGQ